MNPLALVGRLAVHERTVESVLVLNTVVFKYYKLVGLWVQSVASSRDVIRKYCILKVFIYLHLYKI